MRKGAKDDVDALVYISEQTSPKESELKNLNVVDKNGVFFVEFDSILHSFDVINRNHRCYQMANLEECLKTERILALLADNA